MRGAALAIAIALLLAGCAAGAPASGVNDKQGYNHRELQPDTPGLLTGPRGVWTVYSSGAEAKSAASAREEACTASKDGPRTAPDGSCPAPAKPPRTVLLPKP